MKLHYTPTSPYVRKVVVLALETGLDGRIERVNTPPQADEDRLAEDNPLTKIPAMITDDGSVLYDSRVICEYVDSLHGGRRLFPPEGESRWQVLRRQALGDGILDAAVWRRYELTRPEELQWLEWSSRQKRKVDRGLDALEAEAESKALAEGNSITIGEIAIGCALGYLDLRYEADDWRKNRPALASWYEDFAARESMKATVPPENA